MVRPPYLIKTLTETDTTCRLSWPSRQLPDLLRLRLHGAGHRVHFIVRDGEGQMWQFCCTIRQKGYYKPVITGEWLRFVRSKNLKPGDQVVFYEDPDPRAQFLVTFKRARSIRLLGNDIGGYANEE